MAPADAPSSMNVPRAARQKAMTWLRSNGYNDKEYILVFSEPYLLDEFGGYTPVRFRLIRSGTNIYLSVIVLSPRPAKSMGGGDDGL